MIQFVVSVFDQAAASFSRPVFVRSKGEAIRSFIDEVNRSASDNPLFGHPGDFQLFLVAQFDDERGRFENIEPPERLMDALAAKRD